MIRILIWLTRERNVMSEGDSSKIIGYLTEDTRKNRLRLSGFGVIVGVAAGTVAVVYRIAMAYSAELREFLLSAADGWLIPFYFALLLLMALVFLIAKNGRFRCKNAQKE